MTVEELNNTPPGEAESAASTPADTSTPDAGAGEDDALGKIYDAAMAGHGKTDPEGEGGQEGDGKSYKPVHGPDGKFVSTKPEGKGEDGEQTSLEGEEAEAEPGSTAGEVSAPAHLPQAIKSAWKDIPKEAQSAIVAHQTEMDRKFSDLGRQFQGVKTISDHLNQTMERAPIFQGMTVDQIAKGASELAAVQASLERGSPEDRANTVMQIAQTYGVLPALASKLTGQKPEGGIQELHQEIADLKRQLGERGQSQEITPEFIQEQVSTTIKQRDTEAAIETFASDKSKHPFFEDVAEAMPAFVTMVRERQPDADISSVLETAYDMAINADPAVRQKVRELEAKATTTQTDTKREEAAKKAASINVKSSPGGKERQVSEEEAMAAAYERAMAS